MNLASVDLNLLVLFEVVLQERNIARAAQRMHLTPSAISHRLGRLRRLLDDPLFLRTPRGVVPTARASELAGAVENLLAGARAIVATAAPFDPATATRRFAVGAPDGVSAVFLPGLLSRLGAAGPGVDITLRQLLPAPGETEPTRAWRPAFDDLENRTIDVAVIPAGVVPPRFRAVALYEEDFVIALRTGHPKARRLTLASYCAMQHVVVSASGDPHGFVDTELARSGRSRRIALTVPNFMLALLALAGTDRACAVPRRFAEQQAARFDIVFAEPPMPLQSFPLQAVVPDRAMLDSGLAWFLAQLTACVPSRLQTAQRRAARAS